MPHFRAVELLEYSCKIFIKDDLGTWFLDMLLGQKETEGAGKGKYQVVDIWELLGLNIKRELRFIAAHR